MSAIPLQISVASATGFGGTPLSAFHAALASVNLGHYNLIRLSSVIPPRATIDTTAHAPLPAGQWGDRLYCVYAERRTATPGRQVWAGLGWIERLDGNGGFFVEHDGDSELEVTHALKELAASCEYPFGQPTVMLNGATCVDLPVCTLVIAAYRAAPW
jgi:arginine decarboxylase